MDRNQAKEFYPFLQAFAEGRVIECRTKPSAVKGTSVPNDWTEMKEIEYWNNIEYRIKPKYYPFENAKECWNEMHQPIGKISYNKLSRIWNKLLILTIMVVKMQLLSRIHFTISK